jgi:two-component system, NtrC family, sensor kinase
MTQGEAHADLLAEVTALREHAAATSEILRVISSSPADAQPTFEAIAASATRLCAAEEGTVFRFDGTLIHLAAHCGLVQNNLVRRVFPRPAGPGSVTARAILTRLVVHIPDVTTDPDLEHSVLITAGFRTVLSVPMLRGGDPIGAITVSRQTVAPFSDAQIALLSTFADQAVIAIENMRLFKELQEKNRDLSEALEQQTATSDILKVISSSPTDVQPVFQAVIENAVRLCGGVLGRVFRREGHMISLAANQNFPDDARDFPRPLHDDETLGGRVARTGQVIRSADVETDPSIPATGLAAFRARRVRSVLVVPISHQGDALGSIVVGHADVGAFSDAHVALLRTFADQAVIAIENVRLFNETKEALEQQTATSEILRVISQSPTDLQPVMDAVADNAARICGASDAHIRRIEGDTLRLVARFGSIPIGLPDVYPISREYPAGRAVIERRTIHIDDILPLIETEYPALRGTTRRTFLATPLMREGVPIGVILIRRTTVQPFTDKQISLLKTFADQAVIAIENVRLFTELQEKNRALTEAHGQVTETLEQQTATSEILRVISSSPTDVEPVFETIARSTVHLCEGARSTVWRPEGELLRCVARYEMTPEGRVLRASSGEVVDADSFPARALREREILQVNDALENPTVPLKYRERARLRGYRSLLAVPIVREGLAVGVITVVRPTAAEFSDQQVGLVKTFADQAVIAIENVRLFTELQKRNLEIEQKSRELAAASQHKSEFLANMSHELRTPLNAIIGFSEVLSERMFGELNEKQDEYLKDINASGTHLLSLINEILDLSKIEAGRMELDLSEFDLPTALDSALTLVRERAGRRGIALHLNVDGRLGQIQADERKIRQVVLNLLSNAIKFTPEGGRIEVQATPKDCLVEVSVTDTGVGIALEDQEAVFEEFRQVGTAEKKVEGTGLGLALSRKFVELHGGRIWVKSEVGVGSTFTFSLPLHTL